MDGLGLGVSRGQVMINMGIRNIFLPVTSGGHVDFKRPYRDTAGYVIYHCTAFQISLVYLPVYYINASFSVCGCLVLLHCLAFQEIK